jgi:hypothetical protein
MRVVAAIALTVLAGAPATGLHGRVTYFIAAGEPGSQFRESDRRLHTRADIARVAGLSAGDIERARRLTGG